MTNKTEFARITSRLHFEEIDFEVRFSKAFGARIMVAESYERYIPILKELRFEKNATKRWIKAV